jgi:hypothetical protein
VEVDCLALFLVGMFVSLRWGTLFVKVSKDRLLVVMYGFGLYVVCSCMPSSTAKDICYSWVGILGEVEVLIRRLVPVGCVIAFFSCA